MKINVNGRGPVYAGNGEVHAYPVQVFAHEFSEADLLEGLAAALRRRESLDAAIANMRTLLADFNKGPAN